MTDEQAAAATVVEEPLDVWFQSQAIDTCWRRSIGCSPTGVATRPASWTPATSRSWREASRLRPHKMTRPLAERCAVQVAARCVAGRWS